MSAIPRIHIIQTGNTLPEIATIHGDFYDWFNNATSVPVQWELSNVHLGDPMPSPSSSDGWIISGSPASVNDNLPWLPSVMPAIADAVDAGHPILGICFGHQLLATSLGGKVTINPKGWELGEAIIKLTSAGTRSPLLRGLGTNAAVYESHNEIVVELPNAAILLADNGMGIQSFGFGDCVWGVQFHPEFTSDVAAMYQMLRNHSTEVEPLISNDSHLIITNFINYMTS